MDYKAKLLEKAKKANVKYELFKIWANKEPDKYVIKWKRYEKLDYYLVALTTLEGKVVDYFITN